MPLKHLQCLQDLLDFPKRVREKYEFLNFFLFSTLNRPVTGVKIKFLYFAKSFNLKAKEITVESWSDNADLVFFH